MKLIFQHAHTANPWAFLIAASTLTLIFVLRRYFPRLPGVIMAVILATLVTTFFHLPIETIQSKFGGIPRTLPSPSLPAFSWETVVRVFPDAITIAFLAGIESLLSALVADGMTGYRHRSNTELVAQGLGNIGSIFFGGIPATGAIARTTANIKMGAKSPIASMIHAVTLLLLMLFFAPLAAKIPLAALASVLIFVAYNMSELPHFIALLRGQKGEAFLLLLTFALTVLVDLTVAVQVGVVLAAVLFLKRMTDKTTLESCETPSTASDVAVYEIKGPFVYSVANLLEDTLHKFATPPRVFILRVNRVPFIDSTGMHAIKKFAHTCKQKGVSFLIADAHDKVHLFTKYKIDHAVGRENIFPNLESALDFSKSQKIFN